MTRAPAKDNKKGEKNVLVGDKLAVFSGYESEGCLQFVSL